MLQYKETFVKYQTFIISTIGATVLVYFAMCDRWRYCKATGMCERKVSSNRGNWSNILSHRAKQ